MATGSKANMARNWKGQEGISGASTESARDPIIVWNTTRGFEGTKAFLKIEVDIEEFMLNVCLSNQSRLILQVFSKTVLWQ